MTKFITSFLGIKVFYPLTSTVRQLNYTCCGNREKYLASVLCVYYRNTQIPQTNFVGRVLVQDLLVMEITELNSTLFQLIMCSCVVWVRFAVHKNICFIHGNYCYYFVDYTDWTRPLPDWTRLVTSVPVKLQSGPFNSYHLGLPPTPVKQTYDDSVGHFCIYHKMYSHFIIYSRIILQSFH